MTFLVDQPPSMIFFFGRGNTSKYGDSISISQRCKTQCVLFLDITHGNEPHQNEKREACRQG